MVVCNSVGWKRIFSLPKRKHGAPVGRASFPSRCAPLERIEEDSVNDDLQVSPAKCVEIVDLVQRGDRIGLEELYSVFGRGIRYYLCRHLGPRDLDDRMHDTFLIVVQAIRREELREPGRLLGFIRTIVKRQVAAHIEREVNERRDCQEAEVVRLKLEDWRLTPEERAVETDKRRLLELLIDELDEREREVIRRFYVEDQPHEQICEEMGLTFTQYRLIKSRAKQKLEELGKRVLEPNPVAKERLKRMAAAV
jgi:RNA polymerase sigma-70 factor (ECF subfamily)